MSLASSLASLDSMRRFLKKPRYNSLSLSICLAIAPSGLMGSGGGTLLAPIGVGVKLPPAPPSPRDVIGPTSPLALSGTG